MDVRCEKCQTEYELDETRLKPGGVTVKCTNCGHMFKIRKRTITNVGTAAVTGVGQNVIERARQPSDRQPVARRADSIFDEVTRQVSADELPTAVERQWMIRLENGEQKSCRELATLQQWIVVGVVTRESLISRTGKTWKRLGDISELGQYFVIADEGRAKRGERQTAPTGRPVINNAGTMLGMANGPQASGGTILPDDDDESRTTQDRRAVQPASRNVVSRTPPMGSNAATPPAGAQPPLHPVPAGLAPTQPARRPITTPPPPPAKRAATPSAPEPVVRPAPTPAPVLPIPQGNRATAGWATDGMPEAPPAGNSIAGPSGPSVGSFRSGSAIPDEPAFAGRIRVAPGDESSFETGRVRMVDDDDDLLPVRRGSRAGMWLLVLALLVMGGAAGVVYVFVIKKDRTQEANAPKDAAAVAVVTADATPIITPVIDAAPAPVLTPIDIARNELNGDVEPRLRTQIQALDGKDEPAAQAMRAHVIAQLAQDLVDRAGIVADKTEAENLRKESRQLVLDAATAAQRAFKAAGDDAGANVAMAEVLRLQGKPVKDIKRYLDTATAKADKDWTRDIALADALTAMRDGKLDDARNAFTTLDQGDGKLEKSGDVRARFHLALVLTGQNKPAEAKPLVDAILAAQPDHAGAKALATKLETSVAKTDPLPPEDGAGSGSATKPPQPHPPSGDFTGGESYDKLLAKANALAEANCAKAMELYAKALEQKPNGVEALSGMGYCHIEAKQYASAFSKFRAALAVSPHYEPALWGVGDAYQQQGRKEQAIEAFKAYLEVYPDSPKAKKALDRLGADAGSGSGAGSAVPPPAGSAAPVEQPPPPAGSGSGSG